MTRGTPANPFELLLVEDNPADAELVREAFQQAQVFAHRISVAADGEEAMAFLRHEGRFADAPSPDLVLLDLNLPKKDGREVLAELRSDPALTHLPVVVLTSSEADRDLMFSYRLHANCFVSKPMDLEQFFGMVHAVEQFWFSVAKLPPRDSGRAEGAATQQS